MEIPLGDSGLIALVDAADFELVSGYKWNVHRDKRNVYARRRWFEDGRRRYQFMHNLILGCVGIDHIDRNGLNNQKSNLRPANNAENQRNRRRQRGSSIYKGVCWEARSGQWRAYIAVAGRTHHLGRFTSEGAAARAYDAAAHEFFGEFAGVNFA